MALYKLESDETNPPVKLSRTTKTIDFIRIMIIFKHEHSSFLPTKTNIKRMHKK